MDLIRVFVTHRLAANLLMLLMVLAGVWAISQITVRLNPVQLRPYVNANVAWRGASAEDVEKLVTAPLEQQLKTLPDVKTIWSVTRDAATFVQVEVDPDADVQEAVDGIKQRMSQIRSFPAEIEPPTVYALRQQELVAAVLITGNGSLSELIPLARQMQNELLGRGIDIVDFSGLPVQEIAIQLDGRTLFELGLSFDEIGAQLAALSTDSPGGTIGSGQLSRQLRSLDQRRGVDEFEDLPVYTGTGSLVRLGDIANIERRPLVDQPTKMVGGKPAIALFVRRDVDTDSLEAARNLTAYLEAKRPLLPEGVNLSVFLEAWRFISDELTLILENGVTGLVLVIGSLILFLRLMPAFWVMLGIPVTFMAALLGFYYLGGSINGISVIGFIMALGIVVDDAIVVGEESLTQFDAGKSPADAAEGGAKRMFAPVVASSLTTLCAFAPLLASGDAPLQEIALIMLVVICASLIECFLILPGHLRHALERVRQRPPSRWRRRFNAGFDRFREQRFRGWVRFAMHNRSVVVSAALGLFVVMLLLWTAGWIKTELNLSLDFEQIRADVRFVSGAPDEDKRAFMAHLEQALAATDVSQGGGNLINHMTTVNAATINNEPKTGAQFASIQVEMTSPEKRNLSADEFATAWLAGTQRSPVVDALAIAREKNWFADFSILLKGADAETLKRAGDEVMRELVTLNGVSNLRDNLPWGKDQWMLSLTTAGRALGLSTGDLGRQLRAAYDGRRIQIFQDQDNELEVRLMLPEHERTDLSGIGQFPVKTPAGDMLPLSTLADIEAKRGLDAVRHHNGQRTLTIRGNVDLSVISGGEVVAYFNDNIRDRVMEKYEITTGLDELSLAQDATASELTILFTIVLSLIYIVLAWVFASWSWPLAVMAAIPLGITGALAGHVLLGLHINPMSLLGLFTLTGIIVNDSIILVSTYKRLMIERTGTGGTGAVALETHAQAIEDAVCLRLRPVILTSVTTIAGLFPLMLELAPIGAMFKPLAAAICFGLLYGTVLVLVVIPVLLLLILGGGLRLARFRARLARRGRSMLAME